MAICKKAFSITSSSGSIMYAEGQAVSAEIARMFPQFMDGYEEPKPIPHDPSLPMKLSKAQAEKMTLDKLEAWIKQYHPGSLPAQKVERAVLIELILSLQEQ